MFKKFLFVALATTAFTTASAQVHTTEFNPRKITGPNSSDALATQVGDWLKTIRDHLNHPITEYPERHAEYREALNKYKEWLVKNTTPEMEAKLPQDSSQASTLERQSFAARKSSLETVDNYIKGANDEVYHNMMLKRAEAARQATGYYNNIKIKKPAVAAQKN